MASLTREPLPFRFGQLQSNPFIMREALNVTRDRRIDPNHPVFGSDALYVRSCRTGSPDSGSLDRKSKMGESLG